MIMYGMTVIEFKKKPQAGFTLIELMIGLLIGLIVLSAVIYAFISTLRSSADVLNSARLNREMSNVADIVVGEMRRIGYWPITSISPFGATPDLKLMPSDSAATCAYYSYYNDAVSPGSQIYRGIATVSGALYYAEVASTAINSSSCDPVASGWDELTNPAFVNVSMELSLSCTNVASPSVAVSSCTTAGAGTTYSRSIDISLSAELVRNTEWVSEVSETVKLQNDLSN